MLDPKTEIIVVADFFYPGYTGGAELTTHALASQAPENVRITFIQSSKLNAFHFAMHINKLWIFTNIQNINKGLLSYIARYLKYVIVEYDFKFCEFRSPDKHKHVTGKECDCRINDVDRFIMNAKFVFFMSEKQRNVFMSRGLCPKSGVIGSVFSKADLDALDDIAKNRDSQSSKWIIVYSESWVKGSHEALQYAVKHGIDYEMVQDLKYSDLIKKLAAVKGLVYMPAGADTCPRLVIEARLAGCELLINDNVLHRNEEWFMDTRENISAHLRETPGIFWAKIGQIINDETKRNLSMPCLR